MLKREFEWNSITVNYASLQDKRHDRRAARGNEYVI